MTTPVNGDLGCDVNLLEERCRYLMQAGCDGLALFGKTGEGPPTEFELLLLFALLTTIAMAPDRWGRNSRFSAGLCGARQPAIPGDAE